MPPTKLDPDHLTAEITKSPKYRQMNPHLVRRIAEEEAARQPKVALAVKSARTRLHQLVGAYYDKTTIYAQLQNYLKSLPNNSADSLKAFAKKAMPLHASTQERLPFIESFYATCLAGIPAPSSVLDLGCGLNPLAIPFMPLAPAFTYIAVDALQPMVDFLNAYFAQTAVNGHAENIDLSAAYPTLEADMVIMLKLIPLLDQMDRTLAPRLLQSLNARSILVSFPLKSLGGNSKGMRPTYQKRFNELVEGLQSVQISQYNFPNEMAYLIRKGPDAGN
ncbi:MAG: hypothetical protein VB108_06210 [Anaerolineaceae bacterium]|nr:hypothetical protein [Anaerolineaceae bacterium]